MMRRLLAHRRLDSIEPATIPPSSPTAARPAPAPPARPSRIRRCSCAAPRRNAAQTLESNSTSRTRVPLVAPTTRRPETGSPERTPLPPWRRTSTAPPSRSPPRNTRPDAAMRAFRAPWPARGLRRRRRSSCNGPRLRSPACRTKSAGAPVAAAQVDLGSRRRAARAPAARTVHALRVQSDSRGSPTFENRWPKRVRLVRM